MGVPINSGHMPYLAIFFGILLGILGIVGFVETGCKSPTALIPTFCGLLILCSGIVAACSATYLKHAMHVSAIVAFFGTIGAATRALPNVFNIFVLQGSHLVAFWMQVIMATLCLTFLGFCIKSFAKARRKPPES